MKSNSYPLNKPREILEGMEDELLCISDKVLSVFSLCWYAYLHPFVFLDFEGILVNIIITVQERNKMLLAKSCAFAISHIYNFN